jgi:DNA-binding NarL/FixJ family response regulator
MSGIPSISVLVAASDPLFVDGLVAAIDSAPDQHVVARAHDRPAAVRSAAEVAADVALGEVVRDGPEARELCRALGNGGSTRVLLLAAVVDAPLVATSLEAGGYGVVATGEPLRAVTRAVRRAHAGEVWVDRGAVRPVVDLILARRGTTDAAGERWRTLSPREREVLALLAEGRCGQEIAEALVISPQTARTHVQRVITKLGVHSRIEAARLAVEHGLTGLLSPLPLSRGPNGPT